MTTTYIFFDLGSTLVDERECYKIRYYEMIRDTDITLEELESKIIEFACTNSKADHEAARFFGLEIPKWRKESERLYPETESVLKYLADKGYRLGIIANQSSGTEERLRNWGILKYFSVILASAEEGVSKPDPEIFLRALKKASVDPENAVMIGDRIDNDIIPARQLGMQTVWIKQGFAKYSKFVSVADYTVDSIKDLMRIF